MTDETDQTKYSITKYSIYTSRDLAEAYRDKMTHLVDTVVKAAAMALPEEAHKALTDYSGRAENAPVYIVRARDAESVLDLAIQFVAQRAGVCFWDELEPAKQVGHYFEIGIGYEHNQGATQ